MTILSRSILSFIILSLILKPDFLNCQSLACYLDNFRALNTFHEQLDTPIDGWDGPVSGCCRRPGVICESSAGNLSSVVGLILGIRKIEGAVADSLAELGQLRVLNLSQNLLRGFLPVKLFQMQNLEVLDLSYNDFNGSFHADINLPSIRSFNISNNNFVGPLEAVPCHDASYIKSLDLSHNYFQGEIPISIADCSSLRQLALNGNNLSGNLPEGIFQLRNLQELYLQGNRFSGQLDNRISELVKLLKLDISNNSFSGRLPDSFLGLKKLEHFSAGWNRFSGPLRINCSAMLRITSLKLHSNLFEGPIPEELSTCQELSYLSLSQNHMLSGELSSSFRSLKALRHLFLANTSLVNFSAALQSLQHCKNLTTLILNRNFRNEQIPQDRDLQFKSLKTLAIANSRLRGSLPMWLSGCTSLQVLDLSWNQLSGEIPVWISELNHLFYLELSFNSFTGEMSESFTKLENLTNINFSSIAEVDPSSSFSIYVRVPGGPDLQYNRISNLPPTLDLSSNKLSGSILPGLGNLKGLHVLKLKNNSFSGSIPPLFRA